jgi:hypothetical protein
MSSHKLFQLLASIKNCYSWLLLKWRHHENRFFSRHFVFIVPERAPSSWMWWPPPRSHGKIFYDFMVTRFKCVVLNSKRECLEKKRATSH